jgi:predicted alpha-1,2-mannosidase
LGVFCSLAQARPLVEYVNTLRGSDSSPEFSRGNTFPAVALPFGFNFWTPVTEANSDRWLYTYRAKHIVGFAVSHEPSPWIADHGSIQVMPMFGKLRIGAAERRTPFEHTAEIARAHYYSVDLPQEGMRVAITPTDHASKWRFSFANAGDAYVVFGSIDTAPGQLSVDSQARSIQGFVDQNGPRLYFYARLDHPISDSGVVQGASASGWVKLEVRAGEATEMAMATSFIGVEQARSNLEQEVGKRDFEQVRLAAAAAWERHLGMLEVQGATEDEKVTFYSNLYRTLLYPNSMWEQVEGDAKYFSPYTNQLKKGRIYVNNGFWDTYRAEWPLLGLLMPSKAGEMLEGFVTAFRDGGWVPRWSGPGYVDCMVGSSSDIVFADSYLRGVTGFDIKTAFASMLKNALTHSADGRLGRKSNERAIFKGYVPAEHMSESTAWTLEDTVNDFGIGQIAKVLRDEVHHEYFSNRALRYVTTYSPSVGFFRGRRSDGTWRTADPEFDARAWGYEFTEGNAWHYAAAVTTDPEGMSRLAGGRARFAQKLDAIFAAPAEFRVGSYGQVIHEMREAQAAGMGQYAHSNEPLHSLIYMYNYLGQPAVTARRVRQVLTRLYDSGVGTGRGYLGDEDNGQMSAWYLFSALGFYPAAPGHAEYVIGAPLFQRAVLHLENGKLFTVSAPENSSKNVFVQRARLNGMPYTKSYLSHSDIVAGGLLELEMGPAPSSWGTGEHDAPSSITASSSNGPVFREDLAVGGAIISNPSNPQAQLAFDDDSGTQWVASGPRGSLQYRFANSEQHAVLLYTVTSASDRPDADPRSWRLQASNDCVRWQIIDRQANQSFAQRQQTRVFSVRNRTPFACYRFDFEAKRGAKQTQVAELELIGE